MKKANLNPFAYVPSEEFSIMEIQQVASVLNLTPSITLPFLVDGVWSRRKVTITELSATQLELRRLVKAWQESGPNLEEMFRKDPELKRRTMFGRTFFMYGKKGGGNLFWMPELADEKLGSAEDEALSMFMGLIANPKWELLGGPCFRCGNYYFKETSGKRVYCSRSCGVRATAKSAMRKRREAEHNKKVSIAQRHIDTWSKGSRREDWKRYVMRDPNYKIHWLTRAINRGWIHLPE